MADALETGDLLERPRPKRPAPAVVMPPHLAPAKPRFKGIVASAAVALDERRLFVLLPFAMIAGLIVSIELPRAPHPIALGGGAAVIAAAGAASMRSTVGMRVAVLIAAFWIGL